MKKLAAKEKVKKRFPDAFSRHYKSMKKWWILIEDDSVPELGTGRTVREAWADAARRLEGK